VDGDAEHLATSFQVQACRRRERGRRCHQDRAPHVCLPEVELEAQGGQGLLQGRQNPFHFRNGPHEDAVVQVPPVKGPPLRQGVQGSLNARGEVERAQGVVLLYPPGLPNDFEAQEQGRGLKGLSHLG